MTSTNTLPLIKKIPQIETILIGSGNRKKILEMQSRLAALGLSVKTPTDFGEAIEVEETGTTFAENARLKAIAYAKHYDSWAIGEDSGLCVPALDGQPGIFSARFSGPGATDQRNNDLLMSRMKDLTDDQRSAFYVSTLALANPDGEIMIEADGECHGRILHAPRGTGGFGYDPLFEVIEYHQTFAELGSAVKGAISHRGRSLRKFLEQLKSLLFKSDIR